MKATYIDIKQQQDTTVISVARELSEHPDATSEAIAEKLRLSREELLPQ